MKRLVAVSLILMLWFIPGIFQGKSNATEGYYRAMVKSVVSEETTESGKVQLVLVQIREGPFKGQQIYAENEYNPATYGSFLVKAGQRVLVYVITYQGRVSNAYVQDLDRVSGVISVLIGFAFTVLLVSWGKGLNALLGLLFTGLLLWKIAVPFIASGFNPILIATMTVLASTLVTMWLVLDRWSKVVISTVGTLGGVLAAFLFGVFASQITRVSGITSEVFAFFQFTDVKVNPLLLFYGAIMIAALGATMDVAVSIASSAQEIKLHNPDISFGELLRSLLIIGRDVIGTMVNTIILAYAGAELGLMAFLYASGAEMAFKYATGQFFVGDVVRAVAASTGLILAIPLTATTAAFYHARPPRTH